jgi:hypothetical protein
MGERVRGREAHQQVIDGWLLSVDALPRQTTRRPPVRKPPKLVHNLIFSMPPGTPSEKVLKAVQRLALNEWQLKHRFAMALHSDDHHPHVHGTSRRRPCVAGDRSSPPIFASLGWQPTQRKEQSVARLRRGSWIPSTELPGAACRVICDRPFPRELGSLTASPRHPRSAACAASFSQRKQPCDDVTLLQY